MQERNAKLAQEMQEVSANRVAELEGKVVQVQRQCDQAQQEVQAVRAEYGQQETLVQCAQHLSSLQRDLKLERMRVKQMRGKEEEVVAAKQEVVQANKKLQVRYDKTGGFWDCHAKVPESSGFFSCCLASKATQVPLDLEHNFMAIAFPCGADKHFEAAYRECPSCVIELHM